MAIFRKIHTSFWSDSFVSELDKDKKLFYLYLLTNERTKQCGIYEITKKQISYDTGYSIDTVSKLLEHFKKLDKIRYNESTNELAIRNWLKYNPCTSPTVKSCVDKEFSKVKDTVLILYAKGMDTHSQEEQEEEQEEEREQEGDLELKFDFEIFWDAYDKKIGDKEKLTKKWNSLSLKDQNSILEYIPKYKTSQPDKQYRKNADTFLNNKSWNDEIIEKVAPKNLNNGKQTTSKFEQNVNAANDVIAILGRIQQPPPG
jgi:hypothetical protein